VISKIVYSVQLFIIAIALMCCSYTTSQAQAMCDIPADGFALICGNSAYYSVPVDGSEVMECATSLNGNPFTPDCEASAFDPETGLYYVFIGTDLYAIDTSLPCGSDNVTLVSSNTIPDNPTGATLGVLNGDPVLYVVDNNDPTTLYTIDPATGAIINSLPLIADSFSGVGSFTSIAFDPVSGIVYGINPALNVIFRIDQTTGEIIPCIPSGEFEPFPFEISGFSIGPDGTVYIEGDTDDDIPGRIIYSIQIPPILSPMDCFATGDASAPTPVATYETFVGDLNSIAFNGTACLQQCDLLTCDISNVVDALCIDSADGGATVTALNGNAPFVYLWDNGETTQTATMLTVGPHTVTVTDAFMCELICDVEIAIAGIPLSCMISLEEPILCNGESTGALTVSITGGTAPYNINWFNGLTTETVSNLAVGNYFVDITDSNGCTTRCNFMLTEPPLINCEDVTVISDVSCNGFSDGSASISPTGGTPPLTFLWPSGETMATATALSAGSSFVTVTDANMCRALCPFTINQPTEVQCSTSLIQNTQCAGELTGSARVEASGGTAPYMFLWDNGETTATAVMLGAGERFVTVTDANMCETVCSINILEESDLVCTTELIQNVSCNGEADGSANVTVTGAVPPVAYAWSSGEVTQIAVNLPAGLATVTITDSNDCTIICDVTITEPPLLECNIVVTDEIQCFGDETGVATVVPTGGTSPYTFVWDDGQTMPTATGLDAGISMVTVTDANDCLTVCQIEVMTPVELTCDITLENNVTCNGFSDGSATAVPSGGTSPFTYFWSSGETTQTAVFLVAAVEIVTITDSNMCEVVCNIEITEPDELICNVVLLNDVLCQGESNGSAQAIPTGGTGPFIYAWDNGESTAVATMLDAGLHLVTVVDANMCETFCSITIGEQSQLACTVVLDSPIECGGDMSGIVSADVTGGLMPFSFSWSNGEVTQTIMNLGPDTYTVTITDANGCTTECGLTVTEPPILTCSIELVQEIACFGDLNGSATITPDGGTPGYTFLWDNGETTATSTMLSGGMHTATVTDANDCTTICSILIPEPEELTCIVNLVSPISCFGESDASATVVVSGGTPDFTFEWSNGATTATATMLLAGVNSVTVTDMNGCETICTIDITEPLELTCEVLLVSSVICVGDSNASATVMTANGVEPFNYLWDNGETTATATMLSAGLREVTVTDADGCITMCSFLIDDPDPLICTLTLVNNVTCNLGSDGSATAMATGGVEPYSFSWPSGEVGVQAILLQAGLNVVSITDANDCVSTCEILITEPPLFECNTTLLSSVACFGDTNGSALIEATGGNLGFTFLWDNGETTPIATMLPAGQRFVTVTDAEDCEIVCDVIIPSPEELTCDVSLENNISCFGANDGSATVNIQGGTPDFTFLWSTGETTQTAVSLRPGVNTVVVTDMNGCETTCDIIIDEPLEFTCEVTLVSNVLCAGDTNGSATVTPTNGTAPFTYLWDNGETTATAVMLSGGSHTVTVTDATNCTTVCDIEIMDQSDLSCTVILVNNVSCFGFTDGSATATPTGGSPPYNYIWDNGETTQTAIMLDAGIHTVTVNDINNCGTTCTIEILEPPLLECFMTLENDVSCFGFNDGSATVSATGGTPGYTYLWDDGQTTETAIGLLPGTRTVTITDTNDCETVCDILIQEPPELTCSITLVNNISCFGADDGSAIINPVGGTPVYTFLWDDGQTTSLAVGLTPGLHTATVTDANNCTTICEIIIQEPLEFNCVAVLVNDVLCAGESNGSATAVTSNGIAPFTYLWDNGETTQTAVMLDAGLHTVTVTDNTNCLTVCDVEIMAQVLLECVVTLENNISCFGFDDGSATVNVQGGTPNFTFIWSTGETTQTAIGLVPGTNSVTVTDMNGCETSCTIEVIEPSLLECDVTLENDIRCFGFNDGSATVSATGGIPIYTYLWDDGQTSETAIGLLPGTRSVTVTDANNCETICEIFIAEPVELTCTINTINDISCFGVNDGSAMVTPTGGIPDYTYLWDDGQTTQVAVGLTPGLHTATVTDANGCTTTCEIMIQEPLEFTCTVSLVNDVLCAGDMNGSATAVPMNGIAPFTYLWDNGETTATAVLLTGGGHTVTVTDATNCTTVCDIEIMDQSTLDCIVVLEENVTCFGFSDGSATAIPTGGNPPYNYIWDNGETTQTAIMLDAGIHTVTVNDLNECGSTCIIEILEPPLLECTIALENDISCFGFNDGSATVTPSGGTPAYSILWDDGQTTLTAVGLLPGTRMVTVTDANGCESFCEIIINEPLELTCAISVENDISCFGANDGSATVNPTGGIPEYTFLWDDGQTTQTAVDLTPGLHTATVTDMNNCTTVCEVTILEPLEFTCELVLVNNVLCAGDTNGSATGVPTNGIAPFTFLWDNGETTATAVLLSGGSHTLTITDATNCTTVCDIEIMDQSTLDCIAVLEENVTCFGFSDGSATAMPTGGNPPYNYIWDNGETTQTAVMLDAGIHTVTVNDLNECGSTCTIEILEPPLLECTIALENDISCFGFNDGSATVSAIGGVPGYTFLWDDGQTALTAVGLLPGTRMVTVTDANGCESTCEIFIVEPPELTCSISLVNDVTCFGTNDGSATLVPVGGRQEYTFLWDDGQITQTATGLSPGLHTATVTDASLCTTTCEITILEPLEFTCTVELVSDVLCAGDTNGSATAIPSNGIAPFMYLWDSGETTATAIMLTGGMNFVTITDSDGCETVCDIFIQDQSGLTCEINVINDISCFGFDDGSAIGNPDGGVPPYTYLWDNGETTQTAVALSPGLHQLTISDNNDCGTICLIEIQEPTIISLVEPISTATTTCSGNDDGSASILVTGGTPGYTFLWSSGETTQEAVALPEGPGSVTVTDSNGCEFIQSFTIDPPIFPTVIITNVIPVSCDSFFAETENDGSATAEVSGGIPGYTYLWSNGETTPTAVSLMPGSNSVTVTDQFGCQTIETVDIVLDNCFSIDLMKTGALVNPENVVEVGSQIAYEFEVCNNGTVALNVVTVDDPLITVTGGPINLLPGVCDETAFIGIYTVTQADLDNQFVSNQAVAQGFDVINNNPVISNSDNPFTAEIDDPTVIVIQQPSISLEKFADVSGVQSPPEPGDEIQYVFTICNTGDLVLSAVTVTDPIIDLIGAPIPTLDPGVCNDVAYSGVYVITATNIANGFVENTAQVTSFDTNNNIIADSSDDPTDLQNIDPNGDGNPDDPTIVPLEAAPAVELFKQGEILSDCPEEGDLITYSFEICNTGNIDLINLSVSDNLATVVGSPIALSPGECNTTSYMAIYPITQADVDNGVVINSATVNGFDVNNNPLSDISDDPDQFSDIDSEGDGEADDPTLTFLIQKASILIEKVGVFNDESGDSIAQVGETVSYTFIVRNTGNVTLSDVVVTDPLVTVSGGPIPILGVGEEDTQIFTGDYTLQVQDIEIAMVENTAMTTGLDPIGQPVTNASTELVQYIVRSCDEIVCNNDLQISLGSSCELQLTEDQLIEDPVFGTYSISLFDIDTDTLINDIGLLTEESVGRTLRYQISCGLNSCWGTISIEANKLPEFEAPCALGPNGEINPECTFLCNDFGVPLDIISPEDLAGLLASPCTPEIFGQVKVTETREGDECMDGGTVVTITFSAKLRIHDRITEEQDILTQAYTISPHDLDNVLFPFDITIDCNFNTSPEGLAGALQNNRFGFPTIFDENFVPEGDSILVCDPGGLEEIIVGTREVMQLEIIGGQEVWTLVTIVEKQTVVVVDSSTCRIEIDPESIEGLNFLPIDGRYCNLLSSFSDTEFSSCGSGRKILREWNVIDWCNASNSRTEVQTIEAVDENPPQLIRFLSDVFVNIEPWTCAGTYVLPTLIQGRDFFEACSNVDVEFIPEEGIVDDGVLTELWFTTDPISVEVILTDECGNQSSDAFRIIMRDVTSPVMICNPGLQIILTGTEDNGSATLYAADLDEGSHDAGCGLVDLQIIRAEDLLDPVLTCDGEFLGFEPVTCGVQTQTVLAASESSDDKITDCDDTLETQISVSGDFVKFCCADVGQSVEVILIATDKHGNTNRCIVEVTIEQQVTPQLFCPTIQTDCQNEEITLPEIVGGICAIEEFEPTLITEIEEGTTCANTTMIREWYIDINGNGIVDGQDPTCIQLVTIDANLTTLDPYTIKWPMNYDGTTVEGTNIECNDDGEPVETSLDNIQMGNPMECIAGADLPEPVWCHTDCGIIGRSVELDTIVSSDACFVITKRWTVIDWCTWDANESSLDQDQDTFVAVQDWAQLECTGCFYSSAWDDPTYFRYDEVDRDGYYTYDQVIKIIDQTGPEIFAPINHVVIVGSDNEVKTDSSECNGSDDIEVSAVDSCNGESINSETISWTIVVQKDGEEIASKTSTGSSATMNTQAGQVGDVHTIIWIANDNCGNETTFITTVTFEDSILPTPFCLTGLTSNVPNNLGQIVVWANEFDFGSFDNCASDEELRFSIVPAGVDPIRPSDDSFESQIQYTLNCEDQVTSVELDVWVWDRSDNGDFCTVNFMLSEACDPREISSDEVNIGGGVRTPSNTPIPQASVTLSANLSEYPKELTTNDNGQYVFTSNPIDVNYNITVNRDGDDQEGLSTLDLLMIQRHLIGLQTFDNPYSHIASDANNDSRITAVDIVEIRQLVLGQTVEFTNSPSWVFIDESSEFFDDFNPWPFTQLIDIQNIKSSSFDYDFIGVKIGDINEDGPIHSNEIRSNGVEHLFISDAQFEYGDNIQIPVYAKDLKSIYGLQFTLEHQGLKLLEIIPGQLNITSDHFIRLDINQTTLSWNVDMDKLTLTDEALFTLSLESDSQGNMKDVLKISSAITKSELYETMDELSTIQLDVFRDDYTVYQNEPNPFNEQTIIAFDLPDRSFVTLSYFTAEGKLLAKSSGEYSKGNNQVTVAKEELNHTGLIYYRVESQFGNVVKKMILLK